MITLFPPPAVENLSASAVANKITVSWNASEGADGYSLHRQAPGEVEMTYYADVTATQFVETVDEDGDYAYCVYPYCTIEGQKIHGISDSVASAFAIVPPPAVTHLTATSVANIVQLRWTASPNADGYIIYRRAPGEPAMSYRYIVTNPGFNDSVTTPGYYYYRVYPYRELNNQMGVGPSDTHVFAKVTLGPDPVTNLRVTSVGKTAMLRWTASADADGYIIYRQAPGESRMSYLYIVTNPGFNDTATKPGYHYYRVYPYRDVGGQRLVGNSDKHVYTYVTMQPDPVTDLRVTAVGKTAMLRWTASADAEGYIIYRRAPGEPAMSYHYT